MEWENKLKMENEIKKRYLIQSGDNEIVSYIKLSPKEKDLAEYILNIASEWVDLSLVDLENDLIYDEF